MVVDYYMHPLVNVNPVYCGAYSMYCICKALLLLSFSLTNVSVQSLKIAVALASGLGDPMYDSSISDMVTQMLR